MQETTSRSLNADERLSHPFPNTYRLTVAAALATAVRLYLFVNYYTINNDGVLYIQSARDFWSGNWVAGLDSFYPPLFPLMIAGAFPITGEWELAGQLGPLTLGVLIMLPLYGLLRRLFGQKVALVALFCYAVSPNLARLSIHVRSEIPYIFFVVFALYFLQRAMDRETPLLFILPGIASALAYLIRPEGIGLFVVGAFYLLHRGWRRGVFKRSWLQLGTLIVGFVLFSAPFVLYLKWDTGNWMLSRKAVNMLFVALADHDPSIEPVKSGYADHTSTLELIASRPALYLKKVFIDAFRSLLVFFEALHYSFLPFLIVGGFLCLHGRFWERDDFLLFAVIAFYLVAFALFYVNRRYAVPLVPLALGWVGVGYLAFYDYAIQKWQTKGHVITGVVVALFLVVTLPWTLRAIGRDKYHLRQAGIYLKELPGNPQIFTTNGRVAFYAKGQNQILIGGLDEGTDITSTQDRDYLALDGKVFDRVKQTLMTQGWILAREFSTGGKNKLIILRR